MSKTFLPSFRQCQDSLLVIKLLIFTIVGVIKNFIIDVVLHGTKYEDHLKSWQIEREIEKIFFLRIFIFQHNLFFQQRSRAIMPSRKCHSANPLKQPSMGAFLPFFVENNCPEKKIFFVGISGSQKDVANKLHHNSFIFPIAGALM